MQRYLTQAEQYKQQQRKISQLEIAIKRQRMWADMNRQNSGLAKRALAMERRLEQMDKIEKPATASKLTEEFSAGGYLAKEAVLLTGVHKGYEGKQLLEDVSLSIARNDRIALIGENGCGKTTLIKLIRGEETCDSGMVKVSSNVKVAYMPQIIRFDNENATILDILRYAFDLTQEKARSILANFRFKAPDVLKKVGSLSGGEKSRLKLCMLMQEKVNFLILDEPTNHLDIESREWIEDAVGDWDGTLLFISHDRYFLNKFASRIWGMEDGKIADFYGSYDEYAASSATEDKPKDAPVQKKPRPSPSVNMAKDDAKPQIEPLIYEIEAAIERVNNAIVSEMDVLDYQKLNELHQEKQLLEERLEALYQDWL